MTAPIPDPIANWTGLSANTVAEYIGLLIGKPGVAWQIKKPANP